MKNQWNGNKCNVSVISINWTDILKVQELILLLINDKKIRRWYLICFYQDECTDFLVKTDLTLNFFQIILPNTEMLISWGRGWTSWWSWQRTTTPCPPSTSSDTPPHCLSTNHRLWSRVTSKYSVTGQCSVTRNKKKPTIQSEKQEGASGTLFLYLILTIAYLNCSVLEHWFIDYCVPMLF